MTRAVRAFTKALFCAATLIVAGCATTKGYGGPERPAENTADIRIGWELTGTSLLRSISARLRNPASGDSLDAPYTLDAPPNAWVSVLPPTVCVTVSAQPMFCMPLSQCVPNARPIAIDERNICFDVSPGERYQIDARGIVNDDCWGGVQLVSYQVTHDESGDTIADFPIDEYCTGFMESRVGEWAAAYSGRDGTWGQRVVWRALDAEMRKAWRRAPAYAEWWPGAKDLYAPEFADYVDAAVFENER